MDKANKKPGDWSRRRRHPLLCRFCALKIPILSESDIPGFHPCHTDYMYIYINSCDSCGLETCISFWLYCHFCCLNYGTWLQHKSGTFLVRLTFPSKDHSQAWTRSGQAWPNIRIIYGEGGHYPLVNVYITMEHHHFLRVNPLFLWTFSIAMSAITRGYTPVDWLIGWTFGWLLNLFISGDEFPRDLLRKS